LIRSPSYGGRISPIIPPPHPFHHLPFPVRREFRLSGEVIVDHDDVLVVVLDVWVTFFDDQWAEQSTVELESDVTVVKVRPGGFGGTCT